MREQPSLAGPLVTVLKANTELTVLEDAATAQPKIGQQGQWLNVKDNKGNQGFVAAWLVIASASTPAPSPTPPPEPTPPPDPTPPPGTTPAPETTELRVKVAASVGSSGLRMRSQPSLAGTLVTVVKVLTSLLVLEDPALARPKVGVTNQWLHVRDPKGYEGYVAAWYVVLDTTTPPSEGGTTPSAPPAAGELVVYVSSLAYNGLRMRSGPTTGTAILKVLMPNSPLTVLEANAEAKVGVFNQWLNVRDSSGTEGYVAAWYVHK
jgi:hypothetical protein